LRRELIWSAGVSLLAHGFFLLGMTQIPWSLASVRVRSDLPKVVEVVLLEPEPAATQTPEPAGPQEMPTLPEFPRHQRSWDPKDIPRLQEKTVPPAQKKPQVRGKPQAFPQMDAQVLPPAQDEVNDTSSERVVAVLQPLGSEGDFATLRQRETRSEGNGEPSDAASTGSMSGGNAGGGPLREAIPRYDLNPGPAYPDAARRRGAQGTVLLAVRVQRDGSVGEVKLARTSGFDLLDQAALQTVRGWRFVPGKRDDQPIEMDVRVPVRFHLQ
jgi:periplasmic protein TonB